MPTPFSTPTTRWAALTSRNPLAAHAFIYSVLSTKIYCRPTCPSRLARRANIIFHDCWSEAAAAGFRPCKRCRPDVEGGLPGDGQRVVVEKACGLIEREGFGLEVEGEKWSVRALAGEVGLTESHFCRVFRKVMGCTVGEYRNQLRPKNPQETSPEERTIPSAPPTAQIADSIIFPKPDALADEMSKGDTTANWHLSLAQFPQALALDIDENWPSSIDDMPIPWTPYEHQQLDMDFTDLDLDLDPEMSKMIYLEGFNAQQAFDPWDDGSQFINYEP